MSSSDTTAIVGSTTAVSTAEQTAWADVEYILSTAGFGEKAIEEVQNNGMVTAMRLCTIGVETIKSWRNGNFKDGDINDLLLAKSWILRYKRTHGKFPNDWRQAFTAAIYFDFAMENVSHDEIVNNPVPVANTADWNVGQVPSIVSAASSRQSAVSTLMTSPSKGMCPGTVVPENSRIWISIHCSTRGIHNNYRCHQVSLSETYFDVIKRVLHTTFTSEASLVSELLRMNAALSIYSSQEEKRALQVDAMDSVSHSIVDSSCRFLKVSFFPAINGPSNLIAKKETPVRNAFEIMQRPKFLLPTHYVAKGADATKMQFPEKLFNFLVDLYASLGLGVGPEHLPNLRRLTIDTRDLLQHLHNRVDQAALPDNFRHGLRRKKARTQVQKLLQHTESLNATMIVCSAFLGRLEWVEFKADLQALFAIGEKIVRNMKIDTAKTLVRHNVASTSASNIQGTATIEAACSQKKLPLQYANIQRFIQQESSGALYTPVAIGNTEIDEWIIQAAPPLLNKEEEAKVVRQQRARFRSGLKLDFPVSTFLWQSGSAPSTWILWRIPIDEKKRSASREKEAFAAALENLPKYLSRKDFADFKKKYSGSLGSSLPDVVVRLMFNDLTKNATAPQNTDLQLRALQYVWSNGNPELWPDLRAAINGAPSQYNFFFDTATKLVEDISGATANRHGGGRVLSSAHAALVSESALHEAVCARMDASDNELVRSAKRPSVQLLRVALCPRHESRKVAAHFSGRLNLVRGIDRATMRKHNIDGHYNNKLSQYANALVKELNDKIIPYLPQFQVPDEDNGLVLSRGAVRLSVDDKAAVPIGEPFHPVRSNVRPVSAVLVQQQGEKKAASMDHDFHKASVRPSMGIIIQPPEDVDGSWRRGRVVAVLKEGATQHSTAMRHSVEMEFQIRSMAAEDAALYRSRNLHLNEENLEGLCIPPFVVVRADGGSDRNPKNASVKMAMVRLWKSLNLDGLVCLVTAADISHVNEVEGVMPVVNFALQHQAFDRDKMSDEMELLFKSASSGKAIRDCIAAQKDKGAQEAARAAWRKSIRGPEEYIEQRIANVNYCGKKVSVFPAATDKEIDTAWISLRSIDPNISSKITTKIGIEKECPAFCDFLKTHMRVERYHIEIFKCSQPSCSQCRPVRIPDPVWAEISARPQMLPLPTPSSRAGGKGAATKYLSYKDVKDVQSDPKHRPGYIVPSKPTSEAIKFDSGFKNLDGKKLFISGHVRRFVRCNECNRSRVVFAFPNQSKTMSYFKHQQALDAVTLEPEYEYYCGDDLLGIGNSVQHCESISGWRVRRALTCAMPIEKEYYTTTKYESDPFHPICSYCGSSSDLLDRKECETLEATENGRKIRPFCRQCSESKDQKVGPTFTGKRKFTGAPKRKGSKTVMPIKSTPPVVTKQNTKNNATKQMAEIFQTTPRTAAAVVFYKAPLPSAFKPVDVKKQLHHSHASIEVIGMLVDIKGDGNCGFSAVQSGLLDLQNQFYDIHLDADTFRRQLYQFVVANQQQYFAMVHMSQGRTEASRQSTAQKFLREWIEPNLARKGINYNSGCGPQDWMDAGISIPIVVFKYQVNVVVYHVERKEITTFDNHITFEDILDTRVYQWDSDKNSVQLRETLTGQIKYPTSPNDVSTLHLVFDGSHYMYLQPFKP